MVPFTISFKKLFANLGTKLLVWVARLAPLIASITEIDWVSTLQKDHPAATKKFPEPCPKRKDKRAMLIGTVASSGFGIKHISAS